MALKLGTLFVDIKVNTADLDKAETEIKKTSSKMGRSFITLAGIIAAAFAVKSAVMLADKMNRLDQKIKNVSKSAEQFSAIRKGIRAIAQETGSSIESVTRLASNLLIAGESIGATSDQIVEMTSNLNKLGVIGGSSAEEMGNAMRQFGQAMAGGVVRAEEFNSIVENTPVIAREIAIGMGLTVGELRKAVIEGNVLSEEVFKSLEDRTESINKKFANMPITVERASGMIANSFAIAVQKIDNGLSISESIAEVMEDISKIIDSDLVPAVDDLVLGFQETFLLWEGILGETVKVTDETKIQERAWDNIKKSLIFIKNAIIELPANLKDITTILTGSFDQAIETFKGNLKIVGLFFKGLMLSIMDTISISISKFTGGIRAGLSGIFDFVGADEFSKSLLESSDDSIAETNKIKEQSKIRQQLIFKEMLKIKALMKVKVDASQSAIDQGLRESEELKKEIEKRIALLRAEMEAKRNSVITDFKGNKDDKTEKIFVSPEMDKEISDLMELIELYGLSKEALNLHNAEKLIAIERSKMSSKATKEEIAEFNKKAKTILNLTKIFNKKLSEAEKLKNLGKEAEAKRHADSLKDLELRQQQDFASSLGVIFGLEREAAIASATLGLASAISKAYEQKGPLAFGDVALITGEFAKLFSIIKSAKAPGRQAGGGVMQGALHPVNENGQPELLVQGSKQFLLSGQSGGRIIPATDMAMGGGGGMKVVINNNAPDLVEVGEPFVTQGELTIAIGRAVNDAVNQVDSSLASGRGSSADSVRSGFNLTRNI